MIQKNKKGLSDIVITLMIVVLALVAIGGVWAVVNNLLKSQTQSGDMASKCLNVDVQATKVACGTTAMASGNKGCNITLSRAGQGTELVNGVKVVFKGYVPTAPSVVISSPNATTILGNVNPLVPRLINYTDTLAFDSGIVLTNVINKVEVTPYINDVGGNPYLCGTTTYTF